MLSLVGKSLHDQRRLLIGWMIGLAAYAMTYLSFYGRFTELSEAKMAAMPESVRTAFGWDNFQTGAGYLNAVVFDVFAPLLLIIFATTLGNRAIAALEEDGILDLYLANPITRVRFLLSRYSVVVGALLVSIGVLIAIVLTYAVTKDMGVGITNILAAGLGLTLIALVFGTLAFAVGAITGRRSLVLGVTGAAAVITYMFKAIPDLAGGMYWLRWLSPFHYALGNDPLVDGFRVWTALVLIALIAGLLTIAITRFDRRDVGV